MKTLQQDMTTGNPGNVILSFTLPVFLGNLFQQFYNMADTVIVGKYVGTKALAAVGSTGTVMFLMMGFVVGMTAGFTVLTAQRFGAGDMKEMRQTVAGAAVLSAAVSIIVTAAGMAVMKPLLVFMQTPADIFNDAYKYIMVICAGIFAQMLYNLLAGILRALGNSRVPLYFLVFSAILNIVLDLIFIIVFHLGAAGAAYATVAAQGVSGLLCLVYIIKKVPVLHLEKEDWHPKGVLLLQQLKIGFPMALQFSITAVGTMMVQTSLNLFGSVTVAAFTAGCKIEQIVTQAYISLGATMATYCAQNMGACKIERIREGLRASTVMSAVYSVIISILVLPAGKYMTYLFISGDVSEIMGSVDIYLKCTVVFYMPLAIVNIFRNGIQGMGYGFLPMAAGVVELAARGITALLAAKHSSFIGVCLANSVAWISAAVFLLVLYWYIMKYDVKKDERQYLQKQEKKVPHTKLYRKLPLTGGHQH